VTNTRGPTLALCNVAASDVGSYQLVVTNPYTNATVNLVTLTVATAPQIYRTGRNADGSIALYCVSPPGSTNLVLCATNLSPPIFWRPLSTNVAGGDGDWQYTDTNVGNRQRFYRSRTL
jgi:hypothetical protein